MVFEDIFKNQKSYFRWRVEKVKRIEKRFPILFNVKNKKYIITVMHCIAFYNFRNMFYFFCFTCHFHGDGFQYY